MRKTSVLVISIFIIFFSLVLNFIPFQTYNLSNNLSQSQFKSVSVFVMGMLGVLSIINFKSLGNIDEFWNDLLSGFFDINITTGSTSFEVQDLKIFIAGVVIGSLLLIWLITGMISTFIWIFIALLRRRITTMIFMILAFVCFMALIITFNISEFDIMKEHKFVTYRDTSIIFSLSTMGGFSMFLSAWFIKTKKKKGK
ncbi:hypothetical protein [Mycoplasma phocimorsus]|uniref:Uncharacterized protein n=1 Tax=Mycoplasma phocimorsus TaxID=3045839 RepID=A0AAJ1PR55_9MOLU|nr:hypothetical protein [Mycoplasma phocimorsus]MDJ1645814.1 hypothetical protein [Mycoplasma phocimorsus]MDJ1646461.1 hypothetical protein [Mycoplasma phocimorsus]MDJ1646975.1 hypothetical protein [Mycoplasma phocimorsus]MDJ1647421.1 hypothetical protein [Mycoplasma phocimorsus]MDJ1647933.1 hypothetical protein [Mycoplasma phocimorsus]